MPARFLGGIVPSVLEEQQESQHGWSGLHKRAGEVRGRQTR